MFKPVRITTLLCIFGMLIACSSDSERTPDTSEPLTSTMTRQQVLDAAVVKYSRVAEQGDPAVGYPHASEADSETWLYEPRSWTSGFFPGVLWQLSYYSQQPVLIEQARRWTEPLRSRTRQQTHDVGFLINDSFGKGYRLTGNVDFLPHIEQGAMTLNGRYDARIRATRSWNTDGRFTVIIDNVMNLVLLFEAARFFSEETYYESAYQHALTVVREFIREDGGSYHVVDFDEQNATVRRKYTVQGKSDDSTWARGQAWGIYGLAYAYLETGDDTLLQASQRMADYFIAQLPGDGVPPWDFQDADSNTVKDTAASAIAASGMWLLAQGLGQEQGVSYRDASRLLVDNLLNDEFINLAGEADALLRHATGHFPASEDIDVSLIYADYFLVEALLMQQGLSDRPL